MAECAWDTIISANKKAELKYRNVIPILKYSLGCNGPIKHRDLYPKKEKPSTLANIIEETFQGYEFQSIPDLTFLHKTDHIVTSEFASVEHPLGRITVFSPNGKRLHTFPSQDEEKSFYLFGLTSLPDDDIAVCTGDGISIWDLDGGIISHLTHRNVENCCHVTSMGNGVLATTCITDDKEKCVTLWDIREGKIGLQFGSRPEVIEINPLKQKQKILIRNSDIRLPWFIASDSKMNIYISDRNAQCIKVFDARQGKFLFRFDVGGVDARCQKGSLMPQGIDIDEDDNIFVADQISNSVMIFDKHGEVVRSFPLQLENNRCEPWSLALSNRRPPPELKRNKLISPSRKFGLSYSNRKPRAHVYDLSFCRHYSIGF